MSESRPFNVLGVQQVAIGGLDKNKLRAFWVDIMGLRYGHSLPYFQSKRWRWRVRQSEISRNTVHAARYTAFLTR